MNPRILMTMHNYSVHIHMKHNFPEKRGGYFFFMDFAWDLYSEIGAKIQYKNYKFVKGTAGHGYFCSIGSKDPQEDLLEIYKSIKVYLPLCTLE